MLCLLRFEHFVTYSEYATLLRHCSLNEMFPSHVNFAAICLYCLFAPTVVPETQNDNGGFFDECAAVLEPRRLCMTELVSRQIFSSTFQIEKKTVGGGWIYLHVDMCD